MWQTLRNFKLLLYLVSDLLRSCLNYVICKLYYLIHSWIMGNVESQNGESSIHGDVPGHLSRKHTTRSLRISNKQKINRRSRHSSSVKQNHRNSEASTRSSSTPSIPQSLVENGLELFNAADEFDKFGINPHWTQRVAMTMRPESYQHDDDPLATPTPETSEADTIAQDGGEDSTGEGDTIGEERFLQQMTEGPREGASNKKKRSKSADMWREDSLEFSMSDLSQEHLTSTEEMVDGGEEEEGQFRCPRGSKGSTGENVHRSKSIIFAGRLYRPAESTCSFLMHTFRNVDIISDRICGAYAFIWWLEVFTDIFSDTIELKYISRFLFVLFKKNNK